MSVNVIPTFQAIQFSTNVNLLLQQRGSKLSGAVTMGTYTGKQASPVDQVGAVTAQKVVSRFAPMNRVDAPTDRRWVFPSDYDLPQLIDTFDKLRLLTDPESVYVQNAFYAMGRAMDDEIIAAFFGTAKTGELGATNTSFLAANVVSVNQGGTASNLNVAKLREAKRLLMSYEVDLDADQIFCAVTSTEHDKLLNEIQIISREFNETPVLVQGKVQSFLGINFIHCERLTTGTDDAAGTSRAVPIWAKSGMHVGKWSDISASVSVRNDLQGEPFQAYVKGTFGATRLEEKKIIKVWCR